MKGYLDKTVAVFCMVLAVCVISFVLVSIYFSY
jgi:hypothetical protein